MVEINIIEETKKILEQMAKNKEASFVTFVDVLAELAIIGWLSAKSDEIFLVCEQKTNKAFRRISKVKGFYEVDLKSYFSDGSPNLKLPKLFIIPGAQKNSEPVSGAMKTSLGISLPTGKNVKFSYKNTSWNGLVGTVGHFVL